MSSQRNKRWSGLLAATALLVLAACATTSLGPASSPRGASWVGTWGASETAPAPNASGYQNQTLRLIAHTSLGGDQIRVRLTNVFGTRPLLIGGASVGLQAAGAANTPGSTRALTFGGRTSVTIPPAAVAVSDAVELTVAARANVSVSIFLPADTGAATVHPAATQTSYVSSAGNFVANEAAAPFAQTLQVWPFLSGIDVHATTAARAIVAFGDSITDGYKSTIDANRRWPDYLASRLRTAGAATAIVNHGISGNRILHDAVAARPMFGPNALSRFDRNVLSVTGATHVVVLIGINDIGMGGPQRNPSESVSAEDIVGGLRQIAARARARGLKVIGATLTPFGGAAYYSAQGEDQREAVNAWIRGAQDFDGYIDFDRATRDPATPNQLLPAYDSGDHLHPNDAGYEAMANSIDLQLFG